MTTFKSFDDPELVRFTDPERLLLLPPSAGALQQYVPREVDADFDRALASPGIVLIQAEPFAGARRSAYEALLRNLPDAVLLQEIVDGSPDAPAVLWADYARNGSSVLRSDLERLRAWQRFTPSRFVLAFVDAEQIRALPRDELRPLLPKLVHVRSTLTPNERATLGTLGFDPTLHTVEEVYVAAENLAGARPRLTVGSRHAFADPVVEPVEPAPDMHSAGYRADTDTGVDHLGITADVNMLADLVASRHVTPPLSIGLFGGWGSGKSFFMREMRARVRALADATARAERATGRTGPAMSAYCSSIRQVTFNAWHYAESNLWASLATHLLDNLAATGSEDDLERRANDLAARRRHERSLLEALSSVRVERMLLTAQLASRTDRALSPKEIAGVLARTLAEEDWVVGTGLPRETLDQVRAFADEATGLAAELRNLGRRLVRSRLTRLVVGLGAAASVLVLVLARSTLWPSIIAGGTALVSLLPAIGAVRSSAQRIRRAADQLTERAEEPTRRRLAELDAEQARLERAISDLAPARDLTAFARARDRSHDYRQHLSVVSLVRRDLEVFAAMLARDRNTADGASGPERIVLYIDDLDRCPPDVVVKVLEAIHLLLAQPVFTIVVGADVNWLLSSLKQHYGPVLNGSAGALHYLEKIFQIPFTLAPMDDKGFASLIADLGQIDDPGTGTLDSRARTTPEPFAANESDAADRSGGGTGRAPARTPPAPPHLRPRQLEITEPELTYLAGLAPLIRSPRGTKRLINLYRLLRARLKADELTAFLDGPEPGYEAALVLLAMLVGSPDAPALFHAIETAADGVLSAKLLPKELSATVGNYRPPHVDTYRQWLPLVRRFSFKADA